MWLVGNSNPFAGVNEAPLRAPLVGQLYRLATRQTDRDILIVCEYLGGLFGFLNFKNSMAM